MHNFSYVCPVAYEYITYPSLSLKSESHKHRDIYIFLCGQEQFIIDFLKNPQIKHSAKLSLTT